MSHTVAKAFHSINMLNKFPNKFSLGLATAFLGASFMVATPTVGADPGNAEAPSPTGFWQTSGGEKMIEVAPCSAKTSKLCGTIVWSEDRDEVDAVVLKRFRAIDDIWAGGKVYTPGKRRGEDGRLALLEADKLEVSECKRGLCTQRVWERVSASDVAARRDLLTAQN